MVESQHDGRGSEWRFREALERTHSNEISKRVWPSLWPMPADAHSPHAVACLRAHWRAGTRPGTTSVDLKARDLSDVIGDSAPLPGARAGADPQGAARVFTRAFGAHLGHVRRLHSCMAEHCAEGCKCKTQALNRHDASQ